MQSMTRLLRTSIALALLMTCAAVPASAAPSAQAPGYAEPNPLAGQQWWVDREWSPSYIDQQRLARAGRAGDAALIGKIANQPQFKWYGKWAGATSPERTMRKDLARFARQMPGSVPLIASMRHEGKGCSPSYTGGGAAADAAFRRWIRGFARAIGTRRVVVAYEPDSLGTVECLARSRRKARLGTLAYGVDVLSKLPNATVYLEAGASDWQGAARMAPKLRAVGVSKVRGFMLNATHFDWTTNNIAYGKRLSRLVGGKHFIINTSHNGAGPLHQRVWVNRSKHLWRIENVWCNPPNSALGARPTTTTADPAVDAYLWVERPGYSNGACNGGPATVGAWWRERALTLAKRVRW